LIKRIIQLIRQLWAIQIIRFLFVGGINTVFGYGVFALFILLHLHYVVAALLANICGVLFNFKTTGTLVFKNKGNRLIFRFFGVYIITYFINVGLLKVFDYYGIKSLIAGAIIVLPLSLLSFTLMKKFVFNNSPEKHLQESNYPPAK
jgi:putative flippase GtrA